MAKYVFLISLMCVLVAQSQDTLTFNDYLALVKAKHPSSKQADLIADMGNQKVKEARGNFDPNLFLKYKNKDFKDKEYYSLFKAGVEIPTITGITFQGGYEQNEGYYLNPENNVTDYGVSYIGFTVPLGKGMFTDENRQALRQAKILQKKSIQDRQLALNELLLEAATAYWEWYFTFQQMKAIELTYTLAEKRFKNIKRSFEYGELAQLDTIKAFVQMQDRSISFREVFVNWRSQSYQLNNFIWDTSLVLNENLIPENTIGSYINNISPDLNYLDSIVNNTPYLISYQLKVDALKAERLYKIEKLKPKINLEYNYLYQSGNIEVPSTLSTNYKWGVSASFPLFIRSERAGLKMNTIKLQDTYYNLNLKERELSNKIQAAAFELETLLSQYASVLQNIAAYNSLVAAEQVKFDIGESDLFKLNAWESKFQEALVKQAKLEYKIMKAKAKLDYLSNTFD